MEKVKVGVLAGSGVYDIKQMKKVREVRLKTPFGPPSDAYVVGELDGVRVAFLPRHGRGHCINPSRVNYRANIYGFKMLGTDYLLSINACGSLQEQYAVGDLVVPDQLFDRTRSRKYSFFDDPDAGTGGLVVHVSLADPFCPWLCKVVADASGVSGRKVHRKGTFVIIEGPRYSSKAESQLFKKWGFAIIGMTTIPEAFLAREAGISYAVLAHVTDYDAWHKVEAPVTSEVIIARLHANAEAAKQAALNAIGKLGDAPPSPYAGILKGAMFSDPKFVTAAIKKRFAPLLGGLG